MLKKFWNSNYFINEFLIPVIIFIIYCGVYTLIASQMGFEGVNPSFTGRLCKYLLPGTAIVVLVYYFVLKIRGFKIEKFVFSYSIDRIHAGDLLLLLLPLTPIVQYLITNWSMLSPKEAFIVIVFFLCISCITIFIIPIFLGQSRSTQTLMLIGTIFTFAIFYMPLLSQHFSWYSFGSIKVQYPLFLAIFLFMWILLNLNLKKILYALLILLFLSNSVTQILSQDKRAIGQTTASENKFETLTRGKTPVSTPNIYLLLYDGYVSNEVMQGYGIDNTAQEDFLQEQGFNLYPNVYSVEQSTLLTMSKVFEVSSKLVGEKRKGVSGDSVVHNLLKDFGYKTYGVFPTSYMFTGYHSSYDFSIPERVTPVSRKIIYGVLIGEFRFNLDFYQPSHEQFITEKLSIFKKASTDRSFVYMHTDLPSHSQLSGTCLDNQTELFYANLVDANSEMKQDVEMIIQNDPEAIIVVAGDHGPYLTKNCARTSDGGYDISEINRLDIQDRYGTFLAIRWPNLDFEKYDDIQVLQDLFPAIFAGIFNDAGILESKINPVIVNNKPISGASVNAGIIQGGINDNEPLFLSDK